MSEPVKLPPKDSPAFRRLDEQVDDVMILSQCSTCLHNRGDLTCAAFPLRIPTSILRNEDDHRRAVENDHGIRWEPRDPDAKHPLAQRGRG